MVTGVRNQDRRDVPQHICIIGLGYVGLPLSIGFWKTGQIVTGIDSNAQKLDLLNSKKSYLSDIADEDIADLIESERFHCSSTFDRLAEADAIIVCVPTPLTVDDAPDLSFVLAVAQSISAHLRKGQLVVFESSTFPGTTEDYVGPILETSGLKAGTDFSLAYSPERVNPGSAYDASDIPKIIGGIDQDSLDKTAALYSLLFREIVPVSSPKVAELAKMIENMQRFINISVMNELAILCHKWGINLWEAIDAAATKPYGFMPYYPGPGSGGHCIPVDPLYLDWFSSAKGDPIQFIRLAKTINDKMPSYVVDRILKMCTATHPHVLLLGVTYKADVNDVRESASLKVFEELLKRQVAVDYYDPYISAVQVHETEYHSLAALTADAIATYDVVAILVGHRQVDYELVLTHATRIFDAQNRFKSRVGEKVSAL